MAFLDVRPVLTVDDPASVAFHRLCVEVASPCCPMGARLPSRLGPALLHGVNCLTNLGVLFDPISNARASGVRHVAPVGRISTESLLSLQISNGYSLTIVLPSPIVS